MRIKPVAGPAQEGAGGSGVISQNAPGWSADILETAIAFKLRRAQISVTRDFQDTFADFKLRGSEFSVLALVAENAGLKQTEIARTLGIKRANLVALIDRLEERQLIDRRKGTIDRRSHSLHLTEKGRDLAARLSRLWKEHQQRIDDRLGGIDERDRLVQLLERLIDDLDP